MSVPLHLLTGIRIVGLLILALTGLLSGLSCSPQMPWLAGPRAVSHGPSVHGDRSEANLEVFDMAWALVYQRYYDPELRDVDWEGLRALYRSQADTASSDAMLYGILADMTSVLQDGHTRVQSPEAVDQEESNIDIGIGIRGEWVEGRFVVTEISPKSPAANARVKRGWVLSTWSGIPFSLIGGRGERYVVEEGQEVWLTFLDARDESHKVKLTGRSFPSPEPKVARFLDDRTLYLRFDRFTGETTDWFVSHLERHDHISGLVVDLRSNRGGQLSALKEILSRFYAQPRIVGEEIHRNGKVEPLRVSGSGGGAFEGSLVVLVDRHSQSAAEVFAAAIQETGRGVVVGRRTAGNVLVSHREQLPDGGELRISTHDYVTVGGRRLEGQGVRPDVYTELSLDDLRHNIDRDIEMALVLIDALDAYHSDEQFADESL